MSSFCFINSDLHLACVCVGMLQATARWEAFFSQTYHSESSCHFFSEMCCYALYCYHLPSLAWKPSEDLIAPSGWCPWGCSLDDVLEVDPFDSLSTWRFLKFPFLLTSRPSCQSRHQWRPSCAYKAIHVLPALCAAPDSSRSSADWSPLSSSDAQPRACSKLTAKKLWRLLWMSRTFSLPETIKLNLEYFEINEFNHDFICEFISRNSAMISRYSSQHCIYTWIHYYEFIYDFIIMNSPA